MTFLNPLLLFGLAAAAIPLIIHLFNFRRPRKVDFSTLEFLKELQQSTMQRVRIKQWLLLALRTLAIAALVLAFARPTLTGGLATLGGRASTSLVVVLDNSLSMTLRDAQGEYLEQARDVAAGIIDQVAPGDEVLVLTTGDATAERAATTSRALALDAIDEVAPSRTVRPLTAAASDAAAWLAEASNLNKELYLITDAQRTTLADSVQVAVGDAVRTYLLPVGERTYANVAVTDVAVVSRIVEAGQPVELEATLVNYGDEPVTDYVASVYLGDERVAQATADLPPNVATTVRFTATPQERGWLGGVVEIEDDAFEADNLHYFTLYVPEQRRLLVVQGDDQRVDYLTLALSSRLTQNRVAFALDTVPESNLSATTLGAYDTVVLVGPRTLSSGEVASLERYVEGGGGLLVFPSATAQAADYNALLGALGGGTFSGFSGALGTGRVVATVGAPDLDHPLFEGMFDAGPDGAVQMERPELFMAMNYTPESGTEQTLIPLTNGFPFLQEIRHGRGAALWMAAAPDPRWSDLPVRGLFVPLLYRTVYYLAAGEATAGDGLRVGTPGELRLAGLPETAVLRLIGPDGDEFALEQRTLFGAALVRTDALIQEPGFYDVEADGRLVRRVAFNLDRRESDLERLTPDAAAERLAAADLPVRLLDAGGGAEQVAAALTAERTGVEIWNVFLLLALAFLVAEMVVARQWQPEAVTA